MSQTDAEVTPFLCGHFALYNTPDGGMLLAYRPDDSDETIRLPIPAMLVRMAQQMGETGKAPNPMQLMKLMKG